MARSVTSEGSDTMSDDPSQFAFHPPAPGSSGVDQSSSAYGGDSKKIKHYEIYDRHDPNKGAVGKAKTLVMARRSVDRRDNQYGSYRYAHRPVYED